MSGLLLFKERAESSSFKSHNFKNALAIVTESTEIFWRQS